MGTKLRRWSEEEKQAFRELSPHFTAQELACFFNRSACALARARSGFKCTLYSAKKHDTKLDCFLGTEKDNEIGKQLGITKQAVWQNRKKLNIPRYKKSPPPWIAVTKVARMIGVKRSLLIMGIKQGECNGVRKKRCWYTTLEAATSWHKQQFPVSNPPRNDVKQKGGQHKEIGHYGTNHK